MEQGSFKRLKAQDGKEYTFNALAFKKELKRTAVAAKQKGIVSSIEAFKEGLADKIAVTTAAIKQWESGRNGVSDIERVQEIAEYLGLEDYKALLIEVKEERKDDMNMANYISEEERRTAREVFNGLVEVIKMYKDSNAYANVDGSYGCPTNADILTKNDEVELIIQKARFDIPEETHRELESVFFEISSTLPEEVEDDNIMMRSLQVERRADEYYKKVCQIMAAYIK
ncbi:hypothetical protein ACTQW9_18685 [Lachnospiraceae bacterium LCP19S3_B12]